MHARQTGTVYSKLAGSLLRSSQSDHLNAPTTFVGSFASFCPAIEESFRSIIRYEDDASSSSKAAPQLTEFASAADVKALQLISVLAVKEACRHGLARHRPLLHAVMRCLPSPQAVDAISSLSREQGMACMLFEAGCLEQMVNLLSSPAVQLKAVVALRNIIAYQPPGVAATRIALPDIIPCLCQLLDSGLPTQAVSAAADSIRLLGVPRPIDVFRPLLLQSSHQSDRLQLCQRLLNCLSTAKSGGFAGLDQTLAGGSTVEIAIARLVAAMATDPLCRQVLSDAGFIQSLGAFLAKPSRHSSLTDSATMAILLAIRNLSECISQAGASSTLMLVNRDFDRSVEIVAALCDIIATATASDKNGGTTLSAIQRTAVACASAALANLIANNASLKEFVVGHGGVAALAQAAVLDPEILEPGLVALAHLTARHSAVPEAHFALVNGGYLSRLFRSVTPAAAPAAAALARNILLMPSGCAALMDHLPTLVAMLAGPSATDAAAALWLMSRDPSGVVIPAIIHHGAISAAARLLFGEQAPGAQCAAVALLWQLTTDASATAQLDAVGVAASLTVLLHSADQAAAAYAAALLKRLAENRPTAFRQRMNTELAQSLGHSGLISANGTLMAQRPITPPMLHAGANGDIHMPTMSPQHQMYNQYLDTDL